MEGDLMSDDARRAEIWPYLAVLGATLGAGDWVQSSHFVNGVRLPFVGCVIYALFFCGIICIALYYGFRANGIRAVAFGILGFIALNGQGLSPFALLDDTWFGRNWIAFPVLPEIAILAAIAWVAFWRSEELGVEEGIRYAAKRIIPFPELAMPISSELIMLYYAFFAWIGTKRAPQDKRSSSFSYCRHEGFRSTIFVFFLISLADAPITHLIVSLWSSKIAWVVTVISLYGSVWLLALFNSCPRRPILFDGDVLTLRRGLLAENMLSVNEIKSVRLACLADMEKRQGTLSFYAKPGSPNVLIELKDTKEIVLLARIRKGASRLLLGIDDPHALVKTLTDAIGVAK